MTGTMVRGGIFAYVSCAGSREIRVLRLDPESGKLAPVQELAVSGRVMPMAVSPDRRFLFAALRSEPYCVASFGIDQRTGELTHLGMAPLPLSALFLSVDASGRWLFTTSIPESKDRRHSVLSVTPIGPHGFVHAPRQVFRAEPKIHSILPDPTNRRVFAASCLADQVFCYDFDAITGRMSQGSVSSVRVLPKAGPRHMAFHPNGLSFYILNETDATLYTFDFDPGSGALTERRIIETAPRDRPLEKLEGADLHLTPDGRFLYASERATSTLSAFALDAMGLPEPIGTFDTERRPRGFNIDPYGRYLLCAGQESHGLSVYAIDRDTGSLNRIGQYPMGEEPNWIEILRLW
ncbi:lactonase family protein [Chelativorans alearense]|uniref:lactonase family protein n=1 Tax=Chelativorans alearense TaxID=2681495 RepID=UPI0013CFAEE1|nr:beta-propeller fold lactonase family protein [Chelativorans alearense]